MQRIAKESTRGILVFCLPVLILAISFNKPSKWESFTAIYNINGYVTLDWSASAEINNPVYTIEHSKDGNSWEVIGTIRSNSDLGSVDHQTFIHGNPGSGTHHYRVNHLGSNTARVYSPIRILSIHPSKEWSIWPAPAHDLLNIQNNQTSEYKPCDLSLFDINGKQMQTQKLSIGLNKVDIQKLQPGNYIIYIESSDGKKFTDVIIKQ